MLNNNYHINRDAKWRHYVLFACLLLVIVIDILFLFIPPPHLLCGYFKCECLLMLFGFVFIYLFIFTFFSISNNKNRMCRIRYVTDR